VVKGVRAAVGKVVVRVEASKEVKVGSPAAVPEVAKAGPGPVRRTVRVAGMSWGQEVR
jgi:hypothetical protein